MVTVNNKLTNLADEIRVLSGVTEPLGLTEMAENVNEANDEVADQTDLISEIAALLEGKSVPGGGGSVETCTVVLGSGVGYIAPNDVVVYTDGNGQIQVEAIDRGTSITALKNSLIVVPHSYDHITGITLVRSLLDCAICKVTG